MGKTRYRLAKLKTVIRVAVYATDPDEGRTRVTHSLTGNCFSALELITYSQPRFIHQMAPKTWLGRLLAMAWLLACVAVLVFGYEQRAIHDMPVAFTWFLLVLAFPVGSLAMVVVGVGFGTLTTLVGLQYQPFWHELPIWIAVVVIGYWQWFVLLP